MKNKDLQKIAAYLLGAAIVFMAAGFTVSLFQAMSSCG